MARRRKPEKLPRDIEKWRIGDVKLKNLTRMELILKLWQIDLLEKGLFQEPVKLVKPKS